MYSLSIPFTRTVLELAPRWGDPLTFGAFCPWLLLAIVPLFLILWLYRYELKLVHRALAHFLLSLRLLVIVVLLFMVGFQPRLLPAFEGKAVEYVLVYIDRTGSMDAADPQRPPLEKLRLARALKLAGDRRHRPAAGRLDSAIPEGRRHSLGRQRRVPGRTGEQKRLEEERRKQHRPGLRAGRWPVRGQPPSAACLSADGGELLDKLGKALPGGGDRFCPGNCGSRRPGKWQEVFDWPVKEGDRKKDGKDLEGSVPPSRAFTDLHLPLANALERAIQGRGAVRGVVLLTDGRQNHGELPLAWPRTWASSRSPRHLSRRAGHPPGPHYPGRGEHRGPPVVLKDPEDAQTINAVVKANVRVRGLPPQPLTVELKAADKVAGPAADHP